MATELPIPTILNIGKLSQVLSTVSNQKNLLFKGGVTDDRLPITIYQVWKPLSLRYAANPNDSTVRQVAEYLLSLCGPYALQAQNIINNLAGSLPVITGPSNQSVAVGANAVFSVSVTSSTNVTYQWFQNGVLIPGATSSSYTVPNAQTSQSGNTYFVTATNATGSVTSNTATLTVTASITGYLYYTTTNPGPTLLANSDPFSYQITYSITHNQPISIPLTTAAANNVYLVVKVPSTESAKTTWFNTNLNQGIIPPPADFVFATPTTFGGWTYYYTKQLVSLDPTQPLLLS
jgi:hypothetical protein